MGRWSRYLEGTGAAIIGARQQRIRDSAVSAFEHRELLQYGVAAQALRQEGRQRVLAFELCSQALAQALWTDRRLRLSHDQRKLAQAMRNTMLLRWYGGIQNVMADRQWLHETLGVTSINDFIICKWPRRRGKTLVETYVATCVAASQASGNVLAFCPVVDQARTWLNQVESFLGLLKHHPRFGWTEESKTSGRSMKIRSTYNPAAVSVIKAYGNGTNAKFAQNLRGTGNDVMLVMIDEGFFFVDAAYEVILPVLANGAACVLVSSMPIAENGGYRLTQIKYKSGRAVATTIDWRPGCSDCRDLEERTRQEVVCRHEPQKVLPFRSKIYEVRPPLPLFTFSTTTSRSLAHADASGGHDEAVWRFVCARDPEHGRRRNGHSHL